MTVEGFVSGISLSNCRAAVFDAKGNLRNTGDTVGTGDVLKITDMNGIIIQEYTMILYGDVNGDGKIDALDFVYIKRHVWGVSSLSGAAYAAGD